MSETRNPSREGGNPGTTSDPPVGNSPPADDLRSLIADITKEQTDRSPENSDAGASADAPASTESEGRSAPERGPNGRFLRASDPRPEPAEKPAGEPPGEGERDKPDEPRRPLVPPAEGEPPRPGPSGAPEHWSAGDKAQFGALSTDRDREIFLGMYKRMEAGYTPRLQRGAQLERDYGELDQIFSPAQRQMIENQGRQPKDIVKIWHQVEVGLGSKPHQAEVAARIIHNYGIDTGQVAGFLNQLRGYSADPTGRTGAPPVGNGVDPASGMHPALAARLDALEADKTQRTTADQHQRLDSANREIFDFANAKDGAGNLLHPFFAELEGEMMQLAYADRLARKQPVVKDLYERAVWANPATRDKQLSLQRDVEERQAADARKAKVEAARRAGSSITGAPRSGQLPNSGEGGDRSIRDSIMAARNAGNSGGRI
jgi:hypothetical protein